MSPTSPRRPVDDFFAEHQPTYVFLAAGKSGGIAANQTNPADLMRDNLLVTAHVIHAAHVHGVQEAPLPGQLVQLSAALCRSRWRSSRC